MKEYLAERALTVRFFVTGKNLAQFLNRVTRGGVTVLSAKLKDNGMSLLIPAADTEKLFAICENLCYNIISDTKNPPKDMRKNRLTVEKRSEGGYLRTAFSLLKRAGVLVGCAAFIALAYLANGRLFGYSLEGVPVESRSGVVRALEENGAVKFAKFSELDTQAISASIVKANTDIGFATVYKRGGYLVVETLSSEGGDKTPEAEDVLSPTDGVIEKIFALRGTPLVAAGDEVKKGQPLVGAYFTAGESIVKTVPVAAVTIRGEFKFVFTSHAEGEYYTLAAVAVAREKCPETNIIGQNVITEKCDGGFKITVTLTFIKDIGG